MGSLTNDDVARLVDGETVATWFLRIVERLGDDVALRDRDEDGAWTEWTWNDYAAKVAQAAAGLETLGVGPGDRVVLMMRNIALFHPIDLGIVFRGATPISIYNSSSPEQIAYLAGHCKAKVAIVEDIGFLERFLKVREELPELQKIVVLDDPDGMAGADVATPADLFDQGAADLAGAAKLATPDSLATVIYTSGTTGPPKGVMISHFNVCWTGMSQQLAFGDGEQVDLHGKRLVSYLPMAHIAERMVGHYSAILNGFEVSSCPDVAQLAPYLREVRPNVMFGVPRVWEKFYAGVQAAVGADPEKKQQFDSGIEAAKPIAIDRSWGRNTPEQDATWDFLQDAAFRGVREMLGLDQVEHAITGAAPIPRELLEWFNALGVPLSEIYGMSECTGPMTWTGVRIKPGTVGPALPGCEVKLFDDGEVCCRGGNVFLGYLDDPAKTAEAIDDDGWLHSGDIGTVDEDGYFSIVDRKKELIITAGGKNVSPANLEAALKTIPLVAQAMAVGDSKPFIAAVVVLDPEVAPVWAKAKGIDAGSLAELAEHPDVIAEVERGVDEVMKQFNNAERVKKVKVLGEEWLPDSEELTPTSKLKRRGVASKYAAEIAALYS